MKTMLPKDWSENSIIDVASYVDYRGKTPQKVESGVFLITARNIKNGKIDYQASAEYISKDDYAEVMRRGKPKIGDVLITTEAPLGNVAQIDNENIALAQRIIKYRGKENVLNNDYLKYYLSSDLFQLELLNKSTGSTVKGIKGTVLHKLKIAFPQLHEQEKIAGILSTWDLAIEKEEQLIEKKKEFKKGIMQRLLSGEVRFKGFNGEWKVVGLENIFERITQKNDIECNNVLTISAQNGLVNQEEYFNKSVSSKDLTGYYVLNNGDFAYNKSYSNGYPLGAIKRLNSYDEGIVSPLYICFRAKEGISACFYEQYFESGALNKEIVKIAQEGARNHGLLNVSVTEFFKDIKIPKPSLEEQVKIAEILVIADKEIELLEKELETLKLQKKGLIQRLLTGEVRVKTN